MKEDEKLNEKVQEMFFEKILSREENLVCADCNAKGPRWVSLSFGVFICMRCAGPHRGLGPLYTKVRSVKLDVWTKDNAEIMEKIGNKIGNEFWEYKMPVGYKKPTVNSSQQELERFVQEKYVKRSFSPPEFVDPVTEYLDAKKNGFQPKVKSIEQPEPVQPKKSLVETKPPLQPSTITTKKGGHDLWDPNFIESDLISGNDKQEWGDYVVAQNPLTPKVNKPSNNIMDMYKIPHAESKKNVPTNNAFPINHSFLNSSLPNNINNPNSMNIMNSMNNINNMNSVNGMNNMKNWNTMQPQVSNMNAMNINIGNNFGYPGMNMMGGPQLNPFMGSTGLTPTNSSKNLNNNFNEKKAKNSGDIMNLYNNVKNETALSGNEMQMNKKQMGQDNILGLYSGNNFNVW